MEFGTWISYLRIFLVQKLEQVKGWEVKTDKFGKWAFNVSSPRLRSVSFWLECVGISAFSDFWFLQCRDAIISGTHPVTYEQALQFAGLQAQAEYGDFDDSRRTIDMRPFLPRSYLKVKGAEKRVFDEWTNNRSFNDIQSKMEYIIRARKLPTYGVTFFLVREKMKGKNKLVPRLFGVTKNSCMRLDEKTKEVR